MCFPSTCWNWSEILTQNKSKEQAFRSVFLSKGRLSLGSGGISSMKGEHGSNEWWWGTISMLEITSTRSPLDHDTSWTVLVNRTAPSAPLIFYPLQFIWSSGCTHSPLQKKALSSVSVRRGCFCMACSDDSEREWRIEARQLCSSKRDPPGKGCESMSVGVGTCATLLAYFKVLCPSPLSHWIHVTTPCVKGFFIRFFSQKSSPTCFSPPPLSYSCRRLAEVTAGSCETKQFQCRLWQKTSVFGSPPLLFFLFLSSLSAEAWLIVCGFVSWLHVEGVMYWSQAVFW